MAINTLIKCRWQKLRCCMRDEDGRCTALNSADFKDKQCHFRKRKRNGVNMYDAKREEKNG